MGRRRGPVEVLVRGLVVFDLDGTLIDSAPLITALINHMLEKRGLARRLTAAEMRPHIMGGVDRTMRAVFETDAPGPLAVEFRALYAAAPTPPECLFAGAREALERLAAGGYCLAVWSNKSQALCDKVIEELGLAPLIAAVVGTSAGTPLKPDGWGLELILARCGGRADHCLLVGDSEVDHAAAAAAGIPMVMMTHGYGDYRRAWRDTVLADGFAALPAIIARLLPARTAAA